MTHQTIEELRALANEAFSRHDIPAAEAVCRELESRDSEEARFRLLNGRGGIAALRRDFDAAREHYERAQSIATTSGDPEWIGGVLLNLGRLCLDSERFDEALVFFQKATKILREIGNPRFLGVVMRDHAMTLYRMDRLDEAESVAQESLDFSERSDDLNVKASSYGVLGMISTKLNSYPEALEQYNRALALHEEEGNEASVASINSNIGSIFGALGDNVKSIEYYLRSSEVFERLGIKVSEAASLVNIGAAYSELGDSESAALYLNKALALSKEIGEHSLIAHCLVNIGVQHLFEKDYEKAIDLLNQGRELAEVLDNRSESITARTNLIECYIHTDKFDKAEKMLASMESETIYDVKMRIELVVSRAKVLEHENDFESSKSVLLRALAESESEGVRHTESLILLALRDLARTQGDFEEYLKFNDAYTALTEELKGADKQRKLAVHEKEREIESRNQELERHKTALYSTLPKQIADRVMKGETVTDSIDEASVMFLDIVGFTQMSSKIPAGHVIHLLDSIFSVCDEVCSKHGVTKIKTIGDSYMAVSFPEDGKTGVARGEYRTASAALEILDELEKLQVTMPPEMGDTSWTKEIGEIDVRIGIHSGPVVAGVLGKDRLQYDVWGDTVNVASRMESTGESSRIQVSEAFKAGLGTRHAEFCTLVKRGIVEIKGKGALTTYFLERKPK